jgi:hypothetical protein
VASSLSLTRQSSANEEQIRQRGGDFQAMEVLRRAAVANLLESENRLDHPMLGSTFARTEDLLRFLPACAFIPKSHSLPLCGLMLLRVVLVVLFSSSNSAR